jgi:hypothetical protein
MKVKDIHYSQSFLGRFSISHVCPSTHTTHASHTTNNNTRRHGNQTTFNLNTLLANNIYQCDYFRAL